jgi:proline iminopeptidase
VRVDVGDGVRLFFDVVGGELRATDEAMLAKPTLLLLHGGPGFDHTTLRPYFDRFAETHQVVYLDQRGHGLSDGRADRSLWTIDIWADDVVRFCTAVGIEAPVVLGNSFGGQVAVRYASRHPEHPGRLVLSSTQARRHVEATAQAFLTLGSPKAEQVYRRIFVEGGARIADWMDYLTVCTPLYNHRPTGFGPARGRFNLNILQHWAETTAGMDLRDEVATLRCPTLVLSGRDDPMCPPVAAEEIAGLLPDGLGSLAILDDCGHGPFRDQPERTEAVLRDFLA